MEWRGGSEKKGGKKFKDEREGGQERKRKMGRYLSLRLSLSLWVSVKDV